MRVYDSPQLPFWEDCDCKPFKASFTDAKRRARIKFKLWITLSVIFEYFTLQENEGICRGWVA